jgi:hypothetical protein
MEIWAVVVKGRRQRLTISDEIGKMAGAVLKA